MKLPVNISKIDGDTELELDLTKPESVQKMSLGKAKVKIRTEKVDVDQETEDPVDDEEVVQEPAEEDEPEEKPVEEDEPAAIESKTFNNVKIEPVGIQEGQDAKLESDATSITLQGEADELKNITKDDINLTVDLSNLDEGTHDVDVAVNAPAGLDWELGSKTISVSITPKDEET